MKKKYKYFFERKLLNIRKVFIEILFTFGSGDGYLALKNSHRKL